MHDRFYYFNLGLSIVICRKGKFAILGEAFCNGLYSICTVVVPDLQDLVYKGGIKKRLTCPSVVKFVCYKTVHTLRSMFI